ncbi:MAG: DUF6460 domain-containing protein [Parvibaculum sp.]|uniref:DUF6460 domain-containing protein n=1 Tax=Parvibaculum sp. TaxID=2024848 RepID=UPI002CA59FA8|nr:DUF6460 domain-containing protein [Parvibaculum sp.]HMM14459.1 DUF6460 domain-containing protein [Parvibaculum sp.]
MDRLFGGPVLPTLLKLAAASVVVGVLLAWFGIRPIDLWLDFLDTVERIWRMGFDAINWSVKYFLLGAVVVVPIWLVVRLWTYLVEKK